jgi:hypothetical protein
VILDSYQENLVALGGESRSSSREPGGESCVQLYQWTHFNTYYVYTKVYSLLHFQGVHMKFMPIYSNIGHELKGTGMKN